ncbi:toxin-antitoxin system YwqK family antitoxin [Flavobacterium phycosphaerae]|uniref:toxin-antitoxin system YwqK family antitoxin n=1 Tax=Flavobacterium phycosphaerae TaxID=2697515 RepID=UPI00138A382E|nr:hypothetical protein [Flavobacterium phycosphaerae]
MRDSVVNLVIGTVVVLSFFSFQEPRLKKRITDSNFKYEFYVTDNKPDVMSDRVYYWFKGGAIHNSENGIAGELLDETFDKFYLNNQLAESGTFKNGLKVGLWKTWHTNGFLATSQYWNDGRRKGMNFHYSDRGELIEKGRYSRGKKQGVWINFISKDTVTFNNGEKVIPSQVDLAREAKIKENKAKRKIKRDEKKKDKQLEKEKRKADKTKATSNKENDTRGNNKMNSSNNNPEPKAKKDNFFKRLFSKKEKSNGKGK